MAALTNLSRTQALNERYGLFKIPTPRHFIRTVEMNAATKRRISSYDNLDVINHFW